jgi:hypothetical protein
MEELRAGLTHRSPMHVSRPVPALNRLKAGRVMSCGQAARAWDIRPSAFLLTHIIAIFRGRRGC